jgi:hypothetical protein
MKFCEKPDMWKGSMYILETYDGAVVHWARSLEAAVAEITTEYPLEAGYFIHIIEVTPTAFGGGLIEHLKGEYALTEEARRLKFWSAP